MFNELHVVVFLIDNDLRKVLLPAGFNFFLLFSENVYTFAVVH
jgi:hypothetical protein